MAVKRVFSNKAKPGWKFDEKKNQFCSWGFNIWLENGKRKRESDFGSRALAENSVARIRINEKEGKYNLTLREFPLVSDVCQKRLLRIESKKEKVRATTVLQRWLEILPSKLKVNEITPAHIQLYIDARLFQIKPVSVNREVTIIGATLHSARQDYPALETWACSRIPRPKIDRSRRERLITQDEVMKLLTFLLLARRDDEREIDSRRRRVVGQVFQMALLTGARIGEITALSWSQIDFAAKILQIVGTKTRFKSAKVVRYLEITTAIEGVLRERESVRSNETRRRGVASEFVFCKTGNSVTKYHQILREASEAVGILYGKQKRGGFITHDARHTAVTRIFKLATVLCKATL